MSFQPGTGPEIKVELLFYEEGVGLSQEEQQQRRMTEDYDSGHGGEPESFDCGCGEKEDREEEKEQEEAEEEEEEEEEEEYPPEILVLGREEEVVEVEEETDQERQLVYWPPVPIELEDGEEDPESDEKEEEESDVEKEEDEGKDENVGGEEEDLLGALTLGPDDIGESKEKQQKEPQPEYGSLIEISDWITVSREGDADEDVEETELVEEDDDPSYDVSLDLLVPFIPTAIPFSSLQVTHGPSCPQLLRRPALILFVAGS